MSHPGFPVLGPLAGLLFLALWALQSAARAELGRGEQLLAGFVVAVLYGWPALFAIARSLRAGAFGRSLRAASIVLAPVVVMLVFSAFAAADPAASWPGLASGIWLFVQLLAVPASWVAARMDFARR